MILQLIEWLSQIGIKVPAVFSYTSTRMMLAALTSLLITILLGPTFIRKLYELKIGQPIRTDECPLLGSLHKNKNNTPTMGGILILFSMFVSLVLWMDLTHVFTWMLLFVMLTLGVIGGYDDYLKLKYKNPKGLSAKKKLLFQGLVSCLIAGYFLVPGTAEFTENHLHIAPPLVKEGKRSITPPTLDAILETAPLPALQVKTTQTLSLQEYIGRIYVPFLKEPIFQAGALLAVFWVFLVITGTSNAVNLTDGLDGLASGCLMMVAACFALIAFISNNLSLAQYLNILYIEGSGEIAVFLSAMLGGLLGFLWYNGHPAQVFMGDIGSLTLGALIGTSAILLRKEVLLALVGGIFVAEALSVITQVLSFKYRNKQRVFLCAPLHHHFEYKGWPETKVVIRFWIVALFLAMIGLLSLKFQ